MDDARKYPHIPIPEALRNGHTFEELQAFLRHSYSMHEYHEDEALRLRYKEREALDDCLDSIIRALTMYKEEMKKIDEEDSAC